MKEESKTEYRGNWYLPNLIDFAAPGKLIVDHITGSITLIMISKNQLNGDPINYDPRSERLKTNLILGEIYNHHEKLVTLYAPSTSTIYDYCFGASHELTFHSEFVFLGVLFEKESDIQFEKMNFKLSHLNSFFHYPAIRRTETTYEFDDSVFLPEFDTDDFQINIKGQHSISIKGNEYKVDGSPFIQIQSERSRPFDDFLKIASELRSFFFFALSEPVRIIGCDIIDSTRWDMKVHYGPWIRDSNLYAKPKCRSMWHSNKFRNERIIEIIQKWFEIGRSYNHSISLFQYAVQDLWRSGNRIFHYNGLTNSLLNLTQAIERMYKEDPEKIKAFIERKDESVHEFDVLRESIRKSNVELTDEQFKKLNNRLRVTKIEKDINYIPLTQIITEYCMEHKEVLEDYIDEDEISSYATELRSIRDNLAHANNSDHIETKFDEGEFSRLFNKTQLLFYVILHRKLGFTDREIRDVLSNLKVLDFGFA